MAAATAQAEAPALADAEGRTIEKANAGRVIAVGGAITEIIYALGAQAALAAVDTTSQYPPDALKRLPNVGYMRALSAEGVLSLRPTLVIAEGEAGPPAALTQLKAAGAAVVLLRKDPSPEGVVYKIHAVARLLGREREGEALAAAFTADMATLTGAIAKAEKKPRVLFVLNASRGVLAAGQNTAADHIIALAGGVNAIQGYTGYKPLAAESVIAGKPDFILATEHGLAASGGADALLKRPDLAETPAGRGRQVIAMNAQLLLGFGPRTPAAVHALAQKLHPGLPLPPLKSGVADQ
ncbi:MAG: heme/hemin ABC transporter substrate-binding protein [Alphaproteobacteria bacterium]